MQEKIDGAVRIVARSANLGNVGFDQTLDANKVNIIIYKKKRRENKAN